MSERKKLSRLSIFLMLFGFFAIACDAPEVLETGEVAQQADEPLLLKSHYGDGAPMWVGKFQRTHMTQSPFDEWFDSGYESYLPDSTAVAALNDLPESVELEVYMGTWCSDSTRDLPRLYRVMDAAGIREDKTRMYALSDHPGTFKQSPGGTEENYLIHRTPTILVLQDGKEMGRIVQNASQTIEQDLVDILNEESYTPRFTAEYRILKLLKDEGVEALVQRKAALAEEVKTLGDPESLWHLAQYDLLFNNKPQEAIAVLDIHLIVNPESARGYFLMAQAYQDVGEADKAVEACTLSLRFEPNNEDAKALLETLQKGI
ncbi:MAG: hypothetical protein HOH43_20215 [Candidatus Latescibacteria bacterium]|jgi:hypothetical protein|nr:hypothetical protein [Candidatus Latescibacterota bacterium]